MQATLVRLSLTSREVLALHYLAGYSAAELAVACGVLPSAIKSRLHEAREQAKHQLLPFVRALLVLQPRSMKRVEPILPRYGQAGVLSAGAAEPSAAQT